MKAKQLEQELQASMLWFAGLVAGCYAVVWLIMDNWPNDAELLWLVRAVVLATHLLIWHHSVGPLHDLQPAGRPPGWLVTAHNTWFCLLLLFQAACIFCLPIIDILGLLMKETDFH
jgi:hypothetical protein